MKIWAFSDVHNEESFIEALDKALESNNSIDAVLLCGDIAETRSFAHELSEMLLNANIKAFYVPGNVENENIRKIFEDAGVSIHEKKILFKDYEIAGLGFSNPTPFNTPGEMPEEYFKEKLLNLNINNNTILMTHCPPFGILDYVKNKNVGSRGLREVLEKNMPLINIFGHIHEVVGIQKRENTFFVNIPPGTTLKGIEITLSKESIEIVMLNLRHYLKW